MQSFAASLSSAQTVFTAVYDGVYHFVCATPGSGDQFFLAAGGTNPQTVALVAQPGPGNGSNLHFTLLMSPGDVLKHQGNAIDLYGYRTSDEL